MYNSIKSYYININRFRKKTLFRIKSMNVKPNEKPIIIFGNQKSGTTAIAALLGMYIEKDVTLDILPIWEIIDKIILKKSQFPNFVNTYSVLFSKHIIKEPWLTFIPSQVYSRFPKSKYILIVRDPRDNIRSILDKLNIPGNKEKNPYGIRELKTGWKQVFMPELYHWKCNHYIEILSKRWNYAVSIPSNFRLQNIFIVRYEDFKMDKVNFIKNLANELGEKGKIDIKQLINYSFQPKGRNRDIPWQEFFGEKNLHRIENICENNMKKYNYKKSIS
ncbi:MAG: sulfotransferase domain-containing protein [Promethearchaeota archaeon]